MRWDLEVNYFIYGVFLAFALLVGILAGFFPAVVLSGFQPVKVLKGLSQMKLFSGIKLRKTLLIAQFTFSLVFIISVLAVFNQLHLFLRADHGFNMDKKMVVGLNNSNYATLKTELLKSKNIENVSVVSHLPAAGTSYGADYKRSLNDKDWIDLNYYSTDEDYLKNLDIPMAAGKFFEEANGNSNKNFIVISEQAVEALNFKSATDAIGQELILHRDSSRKQIIGVVKNYNHQMLVEKMKPMALIYNPDEYRLLQVKYNGSYEEAGKTIEEAWAKVNPNLKVDYKDFYGEVHKIYDIFFGDIVRILSVIAFLSIVISCLGLLGMATYTTETRIKEISIRKILGSSNKSLVYMLSKGYLGILMIAIVIAVPLSYFLNTLWLEQLAYHVVVDVPTISLGVLALISFGVITIGSQTWRATFVKPVENLKSE
ncbi:MAG TPA: hypothetical protein DGG95_08730 [Cytophagales bacterium]|nr:hypothetical protein [Cytophagales bacterium]